MGLDGNSTINTTAMSPAEKAQYDAKVAAMAGSNADMLAMLKETLVTNSLDGLEQGATTLLAVVSGAVGVGLDGVDIEKAKMMDSVARAEAVDVMQVLGRLSCGYF